MSSQLRCLDNHKYSLAFVVTLLLLTATSGTSGDSDKTMNITAVLGENVTIRCPLTQSTPVERLYIQKVLQNKEDVFINGFVKGRHISANPDYQHRTEVNEKELSMKMSNISVSDEGLYKCVVFYSALDKMQTTIYLQITAKYSIPTIKKDCSKRSDGSAGMSCQLSCSALGGYPLSTVTWAGVNQSETNVNWSSPDNDSKTWTINQTIKLNCDKPINVSCAVGGNVSQTITICEVESFTLRVIAAIAFVLVFVFLLLMFVVVMKCCYRRRQPPEEQLQGFEDVPLADCHSQLQHVTTKP
ncbi:hypothetical protein Q8A67_018961 [Cirrhinus molitorella]|uniref:Ig-like domain-containing protein n=1 Tax=Cirrhinus molitorella TaxID=172907 RepID=A0AA88PFG2_9TELE|nr:hypothetical protein Q8A67_018961 [Cirrhinus molitorella]